MPRAKIAAGGGRVWVTVQPTQPWNAKGLTHQTPHLPPSAGVASPSLARALALAWRGARSRCARARARARARSRSRSQTKRRRDRVLHTAPIQNFRAHRKMRLSGVERIRPSSCQWRKRDFLWDQKFSPTATIRTSLQVLGIQASVNCGMLLFRRRAGTPPAVLLSGREHTRAARSPALRWVPHDDEPGGISAWTATRRDCAAKVGDASIVISRLDRVTGIGNAFAISGKPDSIATCQSLCRRGHLRAGHSTSA